MNPFLLIEFAKIYCLESSEKKTYQVRQMMDVSQSKNIFKKRRHRDIFEIVLNGEMLAEEQIKKLCDPNSVSIMTVNSHREKSNVLMMPTHAKAWLYKRIYIS